jgi:oxaloacetate decarboxylase gamma subunit
MTISEMFGQSVIVTLFGMATVFIFLWLIVLSVSILGKVVRSLGLDKDAPAKSAPVRKNPSGGVKPEIAAAITAAVMRYRTDNDAKGDEHV